MVGAGSEKCDNRTLLRRRTGKRKTHEWPRPGSCGVLFDHPWNRRQAAGHEISPDSHGDVRVRILHFRAHKAHPGTPSPSATRSRFSTIRRRRLKKMFPPFMRAFDLMIWLKWALSELHLRVKRFRLGLAVRITSCTEVSDIGMFDKLAH